MLRIALPLLALGLFTGCKIDTGLSTNPVGRIGVAAGDFDDIADPLDRVPVDYDTYEGIISTPTWDPDWDHTQVALSVESLFSGDRPDIFAHETVLVASGVRGLGGREYNSLDPDDHILEDAAAIANVRDFVQNGRRTLVVTDWGYDLIEKAWPDAIDFFNDDSTYDDAQVGEIDEIVGTVTHEGLVEALGTDTMGLQYDYSNWAIIESVHEDTVVYLRGDARYRIETPEGDGIESIADVPMMVSFQPEGALGRVVYASFHIDAQAAGAVDELLTLTVGDFKQAESVRETVDE